MSLVSVLYLIIVLCDGISDIPLVKPDQGATYLVMSFPWLHHLSFASNSMYYILKHCYFTSLHMIISLVYLCLVVPTLHGNCRASMSHCVREPLEAPLMLWLEDSFKSPVWRLALYARLKLVLELLTLPSSCSITLLSFIMASSKGFLQYLD